MTPDLAVKLLPLALLVAVLVREFFRRATLMRRVFLAGLATVAICLWLNRPAPPSTLLMPGAIYLGFVTGLLWDTFRRR